LTSSKFQPHFLSAFDWPVPMGNQRATLFGFESILWWMFWHQIQWEILVILYASSCNQLLNGILSNPKVIYSHIQRGSYHSG
jgi:hypothetical protein